MNRTSQINWRKAASLLTATTMIWGSIVTNAQAGLTLLADAPITAINTVQPNIMFTLDNSGSMSWNYMPDNAGDFSGYYGFSSSHCNGVAYNPAVIYSPPYDDAGNQLPPSPFGTAWNDGIAWNFANNHGAGTSNLANSSYYKYTGSQPDLGFAYDSSGNVLNNTFYSQCRSTNNSYFTKVTLTSTSAEAQNYANWYSYYRTRILMMKSSMGIAFNPIDGKYRVGFYTINSGASNFIDVMQFDNTTTNPNKNMGQKKAWYTQLYSISPNSSTPLPPALVSVGNYFKNGYMSGVSSGVTANHPDPITNSCQLNFNIMSTDGLWNSATSAVGDQDDKVVLASGANSFPAPADSTVPYPPGLTVGQPWPAPYREDPANKVANTLADVATYYWVNDLRTSGLTGTNNVPVSPADPAYWQHMVTFTIGLGVDGLLDYPGDKTALYNGTKQWTKPISNTITTVDDLWHAAVNGHGAYLSAKNPSSLSTGLNAVLNDILGRIATPTGPGLSNPDLSATSSLNIFKVQYKTSNWTGDVQAYAIDPVTAQPTGNQVWSAQTQLSLLTAGTNWNTVRRIVTMKDTGTPIAFRYTNLSPTQQTYFNSDPDVVSFLRGDITYEGAYGAPGKKFRDRTDPLDTQHKVLGDIVNSKALVVAPPRRLYSDLVDQGYAAFKSGHSTRQDTIYVGSNDGMLHAFDAATGNENWAYIPSFLVRAGADGLTGLSYQVSGLPAFAHHYYVDAPPVSGDVDFNNTNGAGGSGDWHTILVGGLGKGGKGFYALDVTDPGSVTDETTATSKVLWEFPNPNDSTHLSALQPLNKVGYTYGKAVITKVYKYGWVVIVPSGYNNADGGGYIFMLDAKTGHLLNTLSTGVGTAADPSGLAKIAGYTITFTNNYVEQIYGGDLKGNLWRFNLHPDINNPGASLPASAQLFATLKDSSGTVQPVTTAPQIEVDDATSKRWVFMGTGKFLDTSDNTTVQTQTMYAIQDGTKSAPTTITSVITRSDLTQVTGSSGAVVTNKGWYRDLAAGERINVDPVADLKLVGFITTIPTSDPCSPGFSGNMYALQYDNGESRLRDANNNVAPYLTSPQGFVGIDFVKTKRGIVNGSPVGEKIVLAGTKSTGEIVTAEPKLPGGAGVARRVSWQELME